MTGTQLSGRDLYHWIALRRVSGGRVATLGVRWLQSGRPVPGYVTDALAEFLERGLVALVDPDPMAGVMARAVLTAAGTNRFEQLCQAALGISAAQFMTSFPWVDEPVLPRRTMTPAGRRLSTSAPLRAPGGQPDPSPADLGSTR